MKSGKAQIQGKFLKIPAVRFEDQKLTSFSGFIYAHLYEATPEEVFQSLKDIAYIRTPSCSSATHFIPSTWIPK